MTSHESEIASTFAQHSAINRGGPGRLNDVNNALVK
jgi:hypothetical protein